MAAEIGEMSTEFMMLGRNLIKSTRGFNLKIMLRRLAHARARLRWLVPPLESGASPRGRRFRLPAKFDHQGDEWARNSGHKCPVANGYRSDGYV